MIYVGYKIMLKCLCVCVYMSKLYLNKE